MPDNPNTGTITYGAAPKDAQGRAYVDWPDGSRFYLRPQDASQGGNGGLIHNPDNWNPKTGQWESGGVNWGALIPWLGLAAIGGSAALAYEPVVASLPSTVASQAGISTAASGGAASATTGGAAASAVPAAVSASGAGGSAVSTAAAAKGLGSLGWASLAGNVGTQALGAYLSNRANNKAIDSESASAKAALDFAKERLARQDALNAPYIDTGTAALPVYRGLLGISAPVAKPAPMAADPNHIQSGQSFPASWVSGNPIGAQPMSSLMAGNDSGFIVVQDPSGTKRRLPKSLETMAIAQGGKVLA